MLHISRMTSAPRATGMQTALGATLIALFGGAAVRSQAPVHQPYESAVDSLVADVRQSRGVPGVLILIAKGDSAVFSKGYGLAELEHDAPFTAASVFNIGSITKQFTAVSILQLAERG